MDFEGQDWVLPDEPQPKPEKVRHGKQAFFVS
jgi:hypothetical protein